MCSKDPHPRLCVFAIKDSTVTTVVSLFALVSLCVVTEGTAYCKETCQRVIVTMVSTDVPVNNVCRSLLVPNVTDVLQTSLAGQSAVTWLVFMATEQGQIRIFAPAIITQRLATGMAQPVTVVYLAGGYLPVHPVTVPMWGRDVISTVLLRMHSTVTNLTGTGVNIQSTRSLTAFTEMTRARCLHGLDTTTEILTMCTSVWDRITSSLGPI